MINDLPWVGPELPQCFDVQIAAEANIRINAARSLSFHRRKVSNFEQI
jgi:hypothetical protein